MGGRGTLAGIALVLLLLFFAVPEVYTLFFSGHPVQDGTEMIFKIDERLGEGAERTYGVKLRFRKKPQGNFRLDVISPHGARSLDVREDSLVPTADPANDELEVATESGMEVRPRMVWLPLDRRVPGKNCRSGLVMGLENFAGRPAWQVMHPDGFVYFQEETGLLAGFELEYGSTKVEGRLRRVR